MKPRLMSLALLVVLLLALSAANASGLILAAPSRGDTPSSSSSALAAAAPAARADVSTPVVSGTKPSSRPAGQLPNQPPRPPRPAAAEAAPAPARNAPDAPAFEWNASLRYVGSVFRPRENDVDYKVDSDGGCVHVTGGDATEVWNVPLTLPAGVQVQVVRMYFYDVSTTEHMTGWLTVYDLYGAVVDEWSVQSENRAQSETKGYGYVDLYPSPAQTIDYEAYSYVLNWQPKLADANLQLCGFRVYYYQPIGVYMPLIRK